MLRVLVNELFLGMLAVIGTGCWIACFIWMHRISRKQNALLEELRAQGKRIEKLSRIEHDLIKEVHPQIPEIKEAVEEVASKVNTNQAGGKG